MRWQGGEDSENLEDRRRVGPTGVALGGGGLLLIVVLYFLGVDPRLLNQLANQGQNGLNPNGGAAAGAPDRELSPEEVEQHEFMSKLLRFTEIVWDEQFRQLGRRYEPPKMVLFYDRVATGCGVAPSAVGPFYCPADRTVYLDPTFFNELHDRLGGSKAEFSQAYVMAHEIGHHVQQLLGFGEIVEAKRRQLSPEEFNEWSVRLELQADYLAGVWAHFGQQKFNFIESGDVEEAIESANAIGDDRLQRQATGFVSPEKFTHGTSKQRVKWFSRGLQTGDLGQLKRMFEMPYEEL